MMMNRTCPHCGQIHTEGAVFCPHTGKPIAVTEAQPPQPTTCPNCGRVQKRGWLACPSCGMVFSGLQRAPAPIGSAAYLPIPALKPRIFKFPKPLVLVCSSVLLAGILSLSVACLFIYLLLGFNQTQRTARVVPAETTALVTFTPTIWQMPALVHYQNLIKGGAVFAVVPGIGDALTQISANFPKTDIDFPVDVLSWIGNEVSVAQIDPDYLNRTYPTPDGVQLATYHEQPSKLYYGSPLLLTAATRNPGKSNALINKIRTQWEKQGIQFNTMKFRGINIIYVSSPSSIPLAFATYKGLVMIGTDVRVITEAIYIGEGDQKLSLYEQKNYQNTLKQLNPNRLGTIFFNCSHLKDSAWSEANSVLATFNIEAVENVGASFGLVRNGLRFDYMLAYANRQMTNAQINQLRQSVSTNALAKNLPNETILYLSGQDMSVAWKGLLASIAQLSGGSIEELDMNRNLNDFRLQTGVDLEKDLLANMRGEYALAMVPDPKGFMGRQDVPFGLLLAIELSNPQKVDESMQNVLRSLQYSSVRVVSNRIGGNEIWLLRDSYSGETSLGYTIADNMMWLGSSERTLHSLASLGNANLSTDQNFSKMIKTLPDGARHYASFDMQRLFSLIKQSPGGLDSFEKNIQPYVGDMETIGFSIGRMNSKGLVRGTMLIFTR